jgi:hypothetical protein
LGLDKELDDIQDGDSLSEEENAGDEEMDDASGLYLGLLFI